MSADAVTVGDLDPGFALVLWQVLPAVRILPHVIYLEWVVCPAIFLLVYVLDSNPIKADAFLAPAAEKASDSI